MITSHSKNSTCPPSNAGMGRMFITAKMTDSRAVVRQKRSQSHSSGKTLPIDRKPPNSSYNLLSGTTIVLICFQ